MMMDSQRHWCTYGYIHTKWQECGFKSSALSIKTWFQVTVYARAQKHEVITMLVLISHLEISSLGCHFADWHVGSSGEGFGSGSCDVLAHISSIWQSAYLVEHMNTFTAFRGLIVNQWSGTFPTSWIVKGVLAPFSIAQKNNSIDWPRECFKQMEQENYCVVL